MVSAWRNFKNIFSRPLFTIIFSPEMLKFHPYSILTGDTMVGFVIFCVLKGSENLVMGKSCIFGSSNFYSDQKALGPLCSGPTVFAKKLCIPHGH